jgi:hypothetical protein
MLDPQTFLFTMLIVGLSCLLFGVILGVILTRPRCPRDSRWQ